LFLAAVFVMALAASAQAQQAKAGPLVIDKAWTRATPGGAKIAGGYVTITNTGTAPDRLVGGSFAASGGVEVHRMTMENGVMKMRALPDGLEIKPGATIELKPGGYHLMFTQLKRPLKAGETLRGMLKFEKAGSVAVDYKVEGIGAQKPMSHEKMH
jgi:copper(I)-binding protein